MITLQTALRSVIFVCMSAVLSIRGFADDASIDPERYREIRRIEEIHAAQQIREDTERQIKEVEEKLAEARKWTKTQFELGERNIIDKPKALASLMKHWQTQRENELYRLLQFPEKSSGAIESGRALNAMMEHVGPAALQNCEIRKINPAAAIPLCEGSQYRKVDEALAAEITWQENVSGAKLIGQGNRGLLDLDWPAALREEQWNEKRQRCDDAIKRVIAEIGSSSGLSPQSDVELREAIAALNEDFVNYRAEWVRGEHPNGDRALGYRRLCDGKRHIEKLVMGAYQLLELSRYQMMPRERFPGGTIEDYIAYFQRNNLRFAHSGPANKSAYHRVFEMMVRYYLDQKLALNLQQRLEKELDKELSELKRTDKEAIDVALGRTMSASDVAAVSIEGLKTVRAIAQSRAPAQ